MMYAIGVAMRVRKRCAIHDRVRIERDDNRNRADCESPAIGQPDAVCRKAGYLVKCVAMGIDEARSDGKAGNVQAQASCLR